MTHLLPWQHSLWHSFVRRPQQAHAYLLHGPAGAGKRSLAQKLANYFLCQQPQAEAACGKCASCLLLAAETHPDLYIVEPEEPGKGILIGHIRSLVDSIQQTAQQGGRQIVILEPAEVMTLESANALLKSLEEPSANTVFLLITHQLSLLLPTIKSRCVLQSCPLPPPAMAQDWLQQQLPELAQPELVALLDLARGSPLKARDFAADNVLQMRADVVADVKLLLKRQLSAAEAAERWNKFPSMLVLEWFADWCQILLRYSLSPQEENLGQEDMHKVLEYMTRYTQPQAVSALQQWILQQRHKLLRRAPLRADLLLESMLAQWLALVRPQ